MLSDELIETLQRLQAENGRPLPVVMWSAGGIDRVEIHFDVVKGRDEIALIEDYFGQR